MLALDKLVPEVRALLIDPDADAARWTAVHAEAGALCDAAFDRQAPEAVTTFHRILFDLYHVNFVDPRDPRAHNQFNPESIKLRNLLETRWTAALEDQVESHLAGMPEDGNRFIDWMLVELDKHSSNDHPLYDYLAKDANLEDFSIFFQSEIVVNNMFEEFVAFAQLGAPTVVKVELAKNYWDEMGNGNHRKVHTEMFRKLLNYFNLEAVDIDRIAAANPVALAQGNLFLMSCINKKNFYRMMGVIGAGEYLVPKRYQKIVDGARRAGLNDDTLEFYIEHISVDCDHAEDWFRNAIGPTLRSNPEVRFDVARGAYFRMLHIQSFSDTLLNRFTN